MRVEVVENVAEELAGVEAYTDAAVERALKNFTATVNGDDSLFAEESLGVQLANVGEPSTRCAATIRLNFRDERMARSRGAYLSALEKLSELLKQAGSADSLLVKMALVARDTGDFWLKLRLEALGNSVEQAGLRWSLGLAHVQQAVLFASRLLRQQIARDGD